MKLKEIYFLLINSKDLWKKISTISISFVILLSIALIKDAFKEPDILVNRKGEAVAIQRKNLDKIYEYPLRIEIEREGKIKSEDVNISTKLIRKKNKKRVGDKDRKEDEIKKDIEVNKIISEIENSKSKKIILPKELDSGEKISWYSRKRHDSNIYVIPIIYVFILIFLILELIKKKKDESSELRKEIIRGLPRFTNQMLLMLNSGMILSDAINKICETYELIPKESRTFFEKALLKTREKNTDSRVSTAMMMNEFASEYGIKELIRLSSIISENERRGSDIIKKLSDESHFLWEERKIIAKEKGKMIDTKMAMPLGLLLILLIVITMAPALISI